MSPVSVLQVTAEKYPNLPVLKVPLVGPSKTTWGDITYSQFLHDVAAVARYWSTEFARNGWRKGSIVGLWLRGTTYSDIVQIWSVMGAGFIPQLISASITNSTVVYELLGLAGAVALISDSSFRNTCSSGDPPLPTLAAVDVFACGLTRLSIFSSFLTTLLNEAHGDDGLLTMLRGFDVVFHYGQPLESHIAHWARQEGIKLFNAYGSTEVGLMMHATGDLQGDEPILQPPDVSGTIGANVTVPTLGDWVYTASEQSVPNPHDPYNAASSAGPTSLDTNQNAYGTTVAAGFFSTSPKLGYGDLCAYDMVMPDIFQVGNDDSLRFDSDCAALTGASHVNWNWNFTSSRNEGNSGGGQAGLYVTDRDKSQGLAAAEPSLRRTINNGYMTWM
ncbi:acetyl-CoA synthetase-like protein [Purpureocillium lavendulum]|uniref:Acetyl-CoA synthetase-like protein n=1 Tax=Purpureocillium lavendulum TaxID=1247861 RepID=A0AB34FSR0_9HYPO|nr:acetyl-CoA synthetase-like protein [Purpureocillium lavendulum]